MASSWGVDALLHASWKGILCSEKMLQLNKKWWTVSSSSPHWQIGDNTFFILCRWRFRLQWPVKIWVNSWLMIGSTRQLASLGVGKKFLVFVPVGPDRHSSSQAFCKDVAILVFRAPSDQSTDSGELVQLVANFWADSCPSPLFKVLTRWREVLWLLL